MEEITEEMEEMEEREEREERDERDIVKMDILILHNYLGAYAHYCKPICRELGMPQMAFDILMFLADNPDFCTARDISRQHGFKENILSVNINKLAGEGFLQRQTVEGDRRKVRLVCTDKAQPIIEKGRRIQASFAEAMQAGLTKQERDTMRHIGQVIGRNAMELLKQEGGCCL